MSPTIDTTPAETLIALVTDTDLLSDEQKELYLSELLEGRLHPELEARLTEICDHEIASAGAEIESLTTEIEAQDFLIGKADMEDDAESSEIVVTHEGELVSTVGDHKVACNKIERELDHYVEGAVRTHKDQPEQDAIRAMLKQKPSSEA